MDFTAAPAWATHWAVRRTRDNGARRLEHFWLEWRGLGAGIGRQADAPALSDFVPEGANRAAFVVPR